MTVAKTLRASRVLRKLRAGEMATCIKLNLADARVAEIAAMSGFDCVWLDLEHVPNTLTDIENGVRAAKMHDCDALVRVPRGGYSELIRPLEMDAAGIMIPHLMSAAEANTIAWQTKFHPVGRRPLDGGNADGAYCAADLATYMRHANDQRFVVVQIEDPEPLGELDAIASTPGIDMLFFGPGDFSQAIGHPGEFDHPDLLSARKAVAAAAARHGKFAGTVGSPANVPTLSKEGYRLISLGADVAGLGTYFRELMSRVGGGSTEGSINYLPQPAPRLSVP